jgi:hypothetical protein
MRLLRLLLCLTFFPAALATLGGAAAHDAGAPRQYAENRLRFGTASARVGGRERPGQSGTICKGNISAFFAKEAA